ncbi:MAG: universal stress protein [Ktedonobacterales bacterium]
MSTTIYRALSQSPILVPLDGSARAEGALPVARQMAEHLGAPLLLARVGQVTPIPYASSYGALPPESYQQLINDERQLARDYLKKQGQLLREQGISVRTVLAEGEAASALLDICASEQVGLVIMTTHGRTGLARFTLGSVADRLVRYSHIPILLLRSYGSASTSRAAASDSPMATSLAPVAAWQIDRVLVPLDGSSLAETALPIVWELAGVVFHHVILERVVPFTASEQDHITAQSYLEAHRRELQAQLASRDCQVVTRICEGVVPSEKIIYEAEEDGCMVVMATHGWGGVKRLVLGSVAEQVVHVAHVPVLLVHPEKQAVTSESTGPKLTAVDGDSAKSPA